MGTAKETVRIFVSSPGDVADERDVLRRVIAQFKRDFAYHLDLREIFWEWEPLLADKHFQEQLTEPGVTDITVVILWSKLGSPIYKEKFRGPLTSKVVTGTEWEFENALKARLANKTPELLVYRKRGAELPRKDDDSPEKVAEQDQQLTLVNDFFSRWFLTAPNGAADVAFREFREVGEFETLVTEHLRKLLRHRIKGRSEPISWHQGSPWRGLLSFDPEHAPIFFGRSRARRTLRDHLESQLAVGSPFVLVLGGSGSGKSSLVKAGLIPDMVAGQWLGRIGHCRYAIIRPSDHNDDPLLALAAGLLQSTAVPELAERGFADVQSLKQLLEESPSSAAIALRRVLAEAGRAAKLSAGDRAAVLIVVDQLEELFAETIDIEQRERFVRTLRALIASESDDEPGAPAILTVATMRSDHFDRLATLPELAVLAEGNGQMLLLPPDADELGEILQQPAEAAGVRFERDDEKAVDLAAELRAVAARDTRVLPLLSFVLDQLWQQRSSDGLLTFDIYRRLGGLEGALARRAEEALGELPKHVREALPNVLTELVRIEPDAGEARPTILARWASLDRFTQGSSERKLIDAFVHPDVRLFVTEGEGDEKRVRIAHESLFTHWQRARKQIETDRSDLLLRQRLEQAHAIWRAASEGEQDARLLPPGLALTEAEDLLRRRPGFLVDDLCSFIEQSSAAARDAQERQLRRTRMAAGMFAVLALLAVVLGVFAMYARGVANEQRELAEERRQAAIQEAERADSERDTAVNERNIARWRSWIATAQMEFPDDPAMRAMIVREADPSWRDGFSEAKSVESSWGVYHRVAALRGHTEEVIIASWSPDGTRIVTASRDGTARVWHADGTGEPIVFRGHEGHVIAASWSPDGTRIVTASRDGTARVWHADGTGEPIVFRGHTEEVIFASWSPDGTRIVTASADRTARVWHADGTGEPVVFREHKGHVIAASWNPAGTRIVTASADRTARVWHADGTGESIIFRDHEGIVWSALWSPDGTRIVTASEDRTARVWRPDGTDVPIVLRGHESGWWSSGLSASWSPDGTRIVTASPDRTARVWRADGTGEPVVLRGHEERVYSASWSPDGTRIVTASPDRTARVWRADGTTGEPVVLRGHEGGLSASWSPDGTRIVTASWDKTARVWQADDTGEPVVLRGHDNSGPFNGLFSGLSASWSPDGTRIATASEDCTARVWRIDGTGEPVVLSGHEGWVIAASWSPDGTRVVTASADHTARVWRADGAGEPIVLRGHEHWVSSASWNPDGTQIATASEDRTARVWRADGTDEPIVLRGHEDIVRSASWSPDGTRIVTASSDKTVRVWRADGTGEPIVLRGHEGHVIAASWSPDGTRIVTASRDGTARVWRVDGTGEPVVLQGHEETVWSASWSPDGHRIVTASGDETARVWRADGAGEPIVLRGHEHRMDSASWSPDGHRIITASWDKTARVWQADGVGEPIIFPGHQGNVWSASWSPDGTRIVTASADGTARVWVLDFRKRLWDIIPDLLAPHERVRYLGETEEEAQATYERQKAERDARLRAQREQE